MNDVITASRLNPSTTASRSRACAAPRHTSCSWRRTRAHRHDDGDEYAEEGMTFVSMANWSEGTGPHASSAPESRVRLGLLFRRLERGGVAHADRHALEGVVAIRRGPGLRRHPRFRFEGGAAAREVPDDCERPLLSWMRSPTRQLAKRRPIRRPMITSSVPGVNARPSVILIAGRRLSDVRSTPRTLTFDEPGCPSRGIELTTTRSALTSGRPSGPAAIAGCARMMLTASRDTPLDSSLSAPFRSRIALRPSPSGRAPNGSPRRAPARR